MALDLPAGKIARRQLVDVDEESTVLDAASQMVKEGRGSVIVTRAGQRIGILTERDLLKKVVARGLDSHSTKVKDVMTSPPVSIDHARPLREAIDLMNRKGVRRMLITEDGKIVGIFTLRDILKHSRVCANCGKEIRSIMDSQEPEPYIECECGARYHKKCVETVVNCVNCSRTLVTNVIYPEPSETFSG
ncbi:MAG TPA: CBS domain-containing protein [Nitrososphaerales archaeon]|nr:CBS domain-containing protein [Nitrososphaerales archaeon]